MLLQKINDSSSADDVTGRGLEIKELIGAPLIAASEANGMMLSQQAKYILDTCFEEDKDSDNLKPIVIPLSLKRSSLDQEESNSTPQVKTTELTFELPLITLIPINTIGVNSVNVDFEMEIVNQQSEDASNLNSKKADKSGSGVGKAKTKLYGKISYDSQEQQSSSSRTQTRSMNRQKLKVNVQAKEVPLPLGMRTMLELYTKSIGPTTNQTTNDQ